MIRRLLLSLAWLFATDLSALVVEMNLPYKEVRLKDGMLFTDAAVKSYNPVAGTATLLVKKELISLPTSLLPDEISARLKELAPVMSKEDIAAEKQKEEADKLQAAKKAELRQQQAEEEAKAIRADTRLLNMKAAEQALTKTDAVLAEVTKTAETRARSFFNYQDDPNSNIGAVVSSDIQLDEPEAVPGWTGRYRVNGTAFRQYINNQASGYGRGSKEFEILIQTADKGKPKVIEIRVKSGSPGW